MTGHLHALWNDLWPNAIAPSVWTLVGIAASHVRQERKHDARHEDMKQHVTAATGGSDGNDHSEA
jgi:hypothetical protein